MFSQNEALVTESFTNEDITSTLLNPTENHSDTEFDDEGSVPPPQVIIYECSTLPLKY